MQEAVSHRMSNRVAAARMHQATVGRRRRRTIPVMVLFEMYRFSPTRRLDWRWQLAEELVKQRRNLPRTLVDKALRIAVEHKRLRHRRRKPCNQTANDDALLAAIQLEHSKSSASAKELIRAWLLAGLSPREVAERCQQNASVVELYQELFFNISDRVHAKDWTMLRGVGGLPDLAAIDGAWLWRWLGYHGGPAVLEAVVQSVPVGPLSEGLQGCPAAHEATDLGGDWAWLFALVTANLGSASRRRQFQQIAQIMREREKSIRANAKANSQLNAILHAKEALDVLNRGDTAEERSSDGFYSGLRLQATAA